MSENKSIENPETDPWAVDVPEGPQNDAIPAQPNSNDDASGIDWNSLGDDELDDLFAEADVSMEEEDSGEAISYRQAGKVYENPLEVGIKEGMWVPVRLNDVRFEKSYTPYFPTKTCVAVKVVNGKKNIYVPWKQVEAALESGATEVIREMPLPYFIAEANHVTPEFGQRRYAYNVEVPALTVKTAPKKPMRGNRTGFKNENGYSLRKATGATKEGDVVNLQTMPDIAKRMDDQVVMARVSITSKPATRNVTDPATDKPITVLSVIDGDSVRPVTVVAMDKQKVEGEEEAGQEYMLNDDSGSIWEGDPSLLVPVDQANKVFAIRDNSDEASVLVEEYTKVTDYINPPFLPVPERQVSVEMIDPEAGTVEGEITYRTVGAIVNGAVSGDTVDVLLRTGKTVTAVWLGTHWTEVPAEGGTSGSLGEFAGVSNL